MIKFIHSIKFMKILRKNIFPFNINRQSAQFWKNLLFNTRIQLFEIILLKYTIFGVVFFSIYSLIRIY